MGEPILYEFVGRGSDELISQFQSIGDAAEKSAAKSEGALLDQFRGEGIHVAYAVNGTSIDCATVAEATPSALVGAVALDVARAVEDASE